MYSIVLMAAIGGGTGTAGADQPAVAVAAPAVPVVVGGCTGCTGYSCTGYASSCYGSCNGRGGFLGHKRSRGCCGGYAYSSSYGCCGGYASGCCGGGGFLGHKRSHGCCGGYAYSSGYGCCGGYSYGCGGYSGFSGIPYFYPTYPAYATPIMTGAAPYYYPGSYRTVPPTTVIPEAKPDTTTPMTPKKSGGASLKFTVPAGATIFVDGQKTPGRGTERSFFTPALEPGQKYFYDVRAEIAIDGKPFVEEKRVNVEAGAEISESFPKMVAALAATTNVAGK